MIKVYQTIVDAGHGNCMQAAIASLFDKKLEEVPNFIEDDGYFKPFYKFINENGYDYQGMLHNKKYSELCTPTHFCFNEKRWHRASIMTPKKLYKEQGVNGLFYAGVLSPKYYTWSGQTTHAVLIDKDYNVVFDPNEGYENLLEYPLTDILGYNGVIDVMLVNPK